MLYQLSQQGVPVLFIKDTHFFSSLFLVNWPSFYSPNTDFKFLFFKLVMQQS